jgi:hypothetical protein
VRVPDQVSMRIHEAWHEGSRKCLFKINFILITKSLDDPFNILNQG